MPYNTNLIRQPVRFEDAGERSVPYGMLAWLATIFGSLVFAYAAF